MKNCPHPSSGLMAAAACEQDAEGKEAAGSSLAEPRII